MRKLLSFLFLMSAISLAAHPYKDANGCVFKGLLNGRIAVEIVFHTAYNNGDTLRAGYIYYPKAKSPAPILIVGQPVQADDRPRQGLSSIRFEEFQPDGSISGRFNLIYTEADGSCEFVKGTWTHPSTGKSLPMTSMTAPDEIPSWYPGLPATLTAPKREAWHFKHHFIKDDDGWLRTICVDTFVGSQKDELSIEEPLCGAFDDYQEKNLTWITEDDINFDGIPDLMVYTGLTIHAQSMYKAYVWNPATRRFYYVEAFEDMVEPNIDMQAKAIVCYTREADCVYTDTFRWKNGKLTKISSKKKSLR